MSDLLSITGPLLPVNPPEGFSYCSQDRDIQGCDPTDFRTAIKERDVFQGRNVCVICGSRNVELAYIITPDQEDTWEILRKQDYFPESARSVRDEPRNGMLLCRAHHTAYDKFQFFIRWDPGRRHFVFINFSRIPKFARYHCRAIFLKHQDRFCPFPAIFLAHEIQVRCHWPVNYNPPVEFPIRWQDWFEQHVDTDGNLLPSASNCQSVSKDPTNNTITRKAIPLAPSLPSLISAVSRK